MHTKKTIYIKLLNEGTEVWRPIEALELGGQKYLILHDGSDNQEDEEWEFLPGSQVICESRRMSNGDVLVATKLALSS